ncbi:MAG: hypothetical protein QXL96_11385 [Ignisphaera sp.]
MKLILWMLNIVIALLSAVNAIAWGYVIREVGDESKKISIEDQLRTDANRLKELTSIKLYFETLIRAIQVIEPLRHVHGNKIDKIYDRIIDLSNKASDGKISEKEVNEIINRFSSLIDGVPEFPYILLEVAEEKLK